MAKYRVTELTVTPTKSEFAPGEPITLKIKGKGERWAESALEWGAWYVSEYILASSGARVSDPREHFHESLQSIDGWEDGYDKDFIVTLANPGPGSYEDEILVKCWKRV